MYVKSELAHALHLTEPRAIFCESGLRPKLEGIDIPHFSIVLLDRLGAGLPNQDAPYWQSLVSSEADALVAKAGPLVSHNDTADDRLAKGCRADAQKHRFDGVLHHFHPRPEARRCHVQARKPPDLDTAVFPLLFARQEPTHITVIEREQVDIAHLVPPVCLTLTKNPSAANKSSFRSLRFCSSGGAPLDIDLQQALQDQLGVPVLQSWGMTETTVGCMGVDLSSPVGSVGKLMPGVEARLVDADGKDVSRGERGELWIRAPNVTKGYYKNPAATAEVISKDGWLRTGDVGVIDKNDCFTMVDRVKELIKYKGFQVPPSLVEGVITTNPKIAAAGVIGVYDKSQATEVPRAFIQLQPHVKDGHAQVESEIIKWVQERCSNPQWLRGGAKVVDRVPVSASGKIVRKELRQMAESEQRLLERSRL
ncbi:hypothetical protein OC846_000530 [Tilletia horrida]|uniref:AMP-dependent synthetase/ligase domain-containing protein n=1 Tax=Tilletia horrida TaxID=155126 RepID=A0AAN6GWT8_9BASI|nr:hypothetical protein OC846_000530 [Tilletia horrida]